MKDIVTIGEEAGIFKVNFLIEDENGEQYLAEEYGEAMEIVNALVKLGRDCTVYEWDPEVGDWGNSESYHA